MVPPPVCQAAAPWRAGVASHSFPIDKGTPMAGYVARAGSSLGTLDPLLVTALVVELGDARVTFIAVDLVAVDAELTDLISRELGTELGRLLLCASHTHSGPAGIVPRLHPSQPITTDPVLRDRFVGTCVEVVRTAHLSIGPVSVRLGQAPTVGVAGDRNVPTRVLDNTLTTLSVHGINDSLLALVVHFAVHPTILGAGNRLISADLVGGVRRGLASRLNSVEGPPILFVNGAAGDVSTRFTRRGQEPAEVDRLGDILANAVLVALADARPLAARLVSGTTSVILEPRTLGGAIPLFTPTSVAVESDLAETNAATDRIDLTRREGSQLLAGFVEQETSTAVEITAFLMGEVALVTIPGELLASLGADLRVRSATPETLVFGYTNGYVGYLVGEDDSESYEALASRFGPEAGPRVVDAAVSLVNRLEGHAEADLPERVDQ